MTAALKGTGRQLGRIAAVGAVALVLVGTMAVPAEAQRRSEAVVRVNRAIEICFAAGGDPDTEEIGTSFRVDCLFPDNPGADWGTDYNYE
jgi:hypothetical protein